MTEPPKPDTRTPLEKYWPYVPAIGSFSIVAALFTHETIVFIILFSVAVFCFLAVIASWKSPPPILTESSNILGSDGNPIELPIFRGKRRKALFVVLFVCVFGGAILYFLRYDLLPSASITTFMPSNIRFFPKGMKTPARDYFLSTGNPNVFEELTCHTAANITVSRNGEFRSKSVRIESVEFDVEHIPFYGWEQRHGMRPHKVEPTRFAVDLRPDVSRVKATMLDDNNDPTEGTLVLNDDHEFAILHVRFEGKTGLYRVRTQITVADGTGKNRHTITHPDCLYVGVREENEPWETDKSIVKVRRDLDDRSIAMMKKNGVEKEIRLIKDKEKARQSVVPLPPE